MSEEPIQVAVVGCGYWGPNLIRNFSLCPQTRVVAICDLDPESLARALRICPTAQPVREFEEILAQDQIDGVAIATPISTLASMSRAALESGKHVLVEKPLANRYQEAEELTELAESRGLTLMVDHTFVYSPPVRMVKKLVDSGELGDIYYIDSVRVNLGLIRGDVNVLWDLAPHDLSIVDFLLDQLPQSVAAIGASHTGGRGAEDVAYMNLDFGHGLMATFHVNWLSPVKIRHFIIGGSKKSLVYDHLDHSEPVKVYDRGITIAEDADARRGILINYRTGDVWSPHVQQAEALQFVVQHFVECIRDGKRPLSDGRAGMRILSILEAAQQSIECGRRVSF
jgi:predicted dehydrogenase